MNQTVLSIFVGLFAGAAGALAVHVVVGEPEPQAVALSGDVANDDQILARLDRIESKLSRETLTAEPALRGTGDVTEALADARLKTLTAALEERLAAVVEKNVQASIREALRDGETAEKVKAPSKPKKKKVTLAVAAAELELSREVEDAVRRIAEESAQAFFELLAGEDDTVPEVRAAFEDAKADSAKRLPFKTKYLMKALVNPGGIINISLAHRRKMQAALGRDKALRLEAEYEILDFGPHDLKALTEFD